MEAKEIYEESYKEVERLKKDISQDNITINFDRLDILTQKELRQSLSEILNRRSSKIFSVISNSNN